MRSLKEIDQLIDEIADRHGLTAKELKSASRETFIVLTRKKCMQALRAEGYTYEAIGWIFNRHHTTVMYALGDIKK